MGKSALLQRIVQGVAELQPESGAILWSSLEMSRESIGIRWLLSLAKVPSDFYRISSISDEEMDRISEAGDKLIKLHHIYVDDSPGQGLPQIRANARRLKNTEGIALIAIDYLQLMEVSQAENRNLELGALTRGLTGLAKELNIPILVLSQLSRAVEARKSKKPSLSDLRDSGCIEQDADMVWLLYREEYYSGKNPGEAELYIAKHRNGPVGSIKLMFNEKLVRFENLAR